jgi:hypothetical protein
MLHTATRVTLIVIVATQMISAQTQKPMKPAVPGTTGDPVWQAVVRMSDGRTFVTDGGMAIDTAVARPATLPEREVPGKVMEGFISVPHKAEYGFGDLDEAATGKTYTAPNGIALSATYVNYLRRKLPRSARFRMTEKLQPIVVVAENRVVCVLMAVAQP